MTVPSLIIEKEGVKEIITDSRDILENIDIKFQGKCDLIPQEHSKEVLSILKKVYDFGVEPYTY